MKVPNASSASSTSRSSVPRWALVGGSTRSPPTMKEGSRPRVLVAAIARAVEVVFPWVPVAPMVGVRAVISSSSRGRFHTVTPARAAPTSSGSPAGTAEEVTTRSQAAIRAGRLPSHVSIPCLSKPASPGPGCRSEPDTACPMAASSLASGPMPAPPAPTTWIRPGSSRSRIGALQHRGSNLGRRARLHGRQGGSAHPLPTLHVGQETGQHLPQ